MSAPRYYARRRVSPFLGVAQVVELEAARAISLDGRHWQLQLLSLYEIPEQVWGNLGPRRQQRRWFIYVSSTGDGAVRRAPLDPRLGDPSSYPALTALLVALEHRPVLPFSLQDRFEAWLCDADEHPVALIATSLAGEDRDKIRASRWQCLPAADSGFNTGSGYLAEQGMTPVHALNHLISEAARHGTLRWQERRDWRSVADIPDLPWRTAWPTPDEQRLFDDYLAYLSPYLLTLPCLGEELRSRIETLAVEQLDLLEFVFPLLPAVVDPGRMEVARVKARLVQE